MHVLRLLRLGLVVWSAVLITVTAGCGGGVATAHVPAANPTVPAVPSEGNFAAVGSVALAAVPQNNGLLAVPLPAGAPYGGTLNLAAPSSIPAGTTLALTLASSSAGISGGIPVLSRARAAEGRSVQSAAGAGALFYLGVASSTAFNVPNAPGFAFSVPSGLPAANYYLALYNPLQPSLGWQLDFEGPATASPSTLTFAAPNPAVPVGFQPFVVYTLAVYAAALNAAPPTPAPSATSIAAPAPPAPFTLSSSALSLLAAGASATAAIQDSSAYAGSYGVYSTNPAVATASISGTTIAVTAVAAGNATIAVSDAQARTASIAVQVTITNVPVQ